MCMINNAEQLIKNISNNPKAESELRRTASPGYEALWDTLMYCVSQYPHSAKDAVDRFEQFQLTADYTIQQILNDLPRSVTAELK
jgi:hypothetical protein